MKTIASMLLALLTLAGVAGQISAATGPGDGKGSFEQQGRERC